MTKKKKIITWIILIILIILVLALSYIKFFGNNNPNITEKPVENSTSTAINQALMDITNNFNNSVDIENLTKDGIVASASTKNYSIFISYIINDAKTTYEFNYNNLKLSINIENNKKNIEKFNQIYKILIKSCQKRINNLEDIDNDIDLFFQDKQELNGITKIVKNNVISYELDITKNIKTISADDNLKNSTTNE